MSNVKRKTNTKIFFLILVFIFPIIIGQILYANRKHLPFKTLNHGTLVTPPISIKNTDFLPTEKKWKVVYIHAGKCDLPCEKMSYQLQQLNFALGKNSKRVITRVINEENNNLKMLNDQWDFHSNSHFILSEKIYLIDPLNNLFMYYPSSTNLMNVLKDLKKVLEVSQIG